MIARSNRGCRNAAMPSERAERDAERHRDHDRGERHHRALPLAEHGEVEEAQRDQQREPAAAGVVRGHGERGDQREPGDARPELDRILADAHDEAGGQQALGEAERLLDQPGDRPGQLLEGEQAEAGVVAQPGHQVVDPALERHHPGGRILERPGHRLARQDQQDGEREQDEPRHQRAPSRQARRGEPRRRGERPSHGRRPPAARPGRRARRGARAARSARPARR